MAQYVFRSAVQLGDQSFEKWVKEAFTPETSIMHKLEES